MPGRNDPPVRVDDCIKRPSTLRGTPSRSSLKEADVLERLAVVCHDLRAAMVMLATPVAQEAIEQLTVDSSLTEADRRMRCQCQCWEVRRRMTGEGEGRGRVHVGVLERYPDVEALIAQIVS